jgi:hypothetical protein
MNEMGNDTNTQDDANVKYQYERMGLCSFLSYDNRQEMMSSQGLKMPLTNFLQVENM